MVPPSSASSDRLGRQLDCSPEAAAPHVEQRQVAEHACRHRSKPRAAGEIERRPEQRVRFAQVAVR